MLGKKLHIFRYEEAIEHGIRLCWEENYRENCDGSLTPIQNGASRLFRSASLVVH